MDYLHKLQKIVEFNYIALDAHISRNAVKKSNAIIS